MSETLSVDELWASAPTRKRVFHPDQISDLPEAAQRYLHRAIASGTRLASAVRLQMHGEIKLKRWLPFTAEQVICRDRRMIWNASVGLYGLPVRGFDRLLDAEGSMRWKLFGVLPLVRASGPNVTRSAIGRVAAESVWLPSVLCGDEVAWTATDRRHPQARLSMEEKPVDVCLTVDDQGRLEALKLARWGNPEGAEFGYVDFGGLVEKEGTFEGYTIPTRLRIGWYFDTNRFESEGEFFRVRIDDATYR